MALMMKGLQKEAIACYDRALSENARDASVIFNKGVALYNLGRREEALWHLGRAMAVGPAGMEEMEERPLDQIGASKEEQAGVMRAGRAKGGARRGRKGRRQG